MKKISGFIFGLAFATAAAYASPCTISAASSSASSCSGAVPASAALGTVSGVYGFAGVPPTIGASYSESVYADASNPFAAGDDTFVLTLTNMSGTGIEHVTLNNFTLASSVAVGTGSGIAATTISEAGGVISFNFTPTELTPSTATEQLIVYTNTTAWNSLGTTGIIDGTAGSGAGLEPTPEPMSMTLLGGGLALVGALRLRRK